MMYTSQVRRMLGQVIIAMAHHHYLSLEGGHLMVEFVVRQCALNLEDKVSQCRVCGSDQQLLCNK